LVLDHEFRCIALLGCYTLQLSLHQYRDDHLPEAPGTLACCVYSSPLLLALTTNGIVCILMWSTRDGFDEKAWCMKTSINR
jgi:hypothetical protein